MWTSPCFEMRPRRCRPPVERCLGVRPRKAAKWRADLNSVALATVATMAVAVILPTPQGIVTIFAAVALAARGGRVLIVI